MTRILFFCMVFWKFSEITKNKPIFSQYYILYNYEYFFFQSAFWSLFNHRQRSQSNQEQCSMCCSSPFLVFAVHSLPAVAMLFNIISKIKRNRSFTAHISWLYYFVWLCLKQWLTGRKRVRGKWKYKNLNISRTKRAF